MVDIETLSNTAITLVMSYAPMLLLALLTFAAGWWLIGKASAGMSSVMTRNNVDPSLTPFLTSTTAILLKVLLVISVASMIGLQLTSFIAILGAAGLAVGMALSGTLQNFAGGVMIMIFKPFQVGDYIEAQGHAGTVKEIQIFNTIMTTPDNKTVIIPNSPLSTNSMVNYSAESTRRVDLVFGIAYDDDIDKARGIIQDILHNNSSVLADPQPFIAVGELGDNSVNLVTRLWVNTADYWDVYFSTQETVKKAFDNNDISIPYPQRDLHVYQENGTALKCITDRQGHELSH